MSNPENPQADNQPEGLEELEEMEEELTGDDLNSISGGPTLSGTSLAGQTSGKTSTGATVTCGY